MSNVILYWSVLILHNSGHKLHVQAVSWPWSWLQSRPSNPCHLVLNLLWAGPDFVLRCLYPSVSVSLGWELRAPDSYRWPVSPAPHSRPGLAGAELTPCQALRHSLVSVTVQCSARTQLTPPAQAGQPPTLSASFDNEWPAPGPPGAQCVPVIPSVRVSLMKVSGVVSWHWPVAPLLTLDTDCDMWERETPSHVTTTSYQPYNPSSHSHTATKYHIPPPLKVKMVLTTYTET